TSNGRAPKFKTFRPEVVPNHRAAEDCECAGNQTTAYGRHKYHKLKTRRPQSQQYVRLGSGDGIQQSESSNLFKPRHQKSPSSGATYVVDTYGDQKILTYGSLDRYAIPQYYRFGERSLVGLQQSQKIQNEASDERILVVSSGQRSISNVQIEDRYTKIIRSMSPELDIQPISLNGARLDILADIVPLETIAPAKSGRRDSISESQASGSVVGKARLNEQLKARELSICKHNSIKEEEAPDCLLCGHKQRDRRRVFSRRVQADPKDLGAWLGLVSCEDHALCSSSPNDTERRSNANIKVSIYEKALVHFQNPEARERLLLGLMKEASIVWNAGKLSTKWRSVVQDNPGYLQLRLRYLNFKQSAFPEFSYEDARKAYSECLEYLQKATKKTTAGEIMHTNLYDIQIYVILRLTLFMSEAGFAEHAVAIWQALLETQFFVPTRFQVDNLKSSPHNEQEMMDSFEDFWNSEVSRIGEEGSKGWAYYCLRKGEPPAPKTDMVGKLEKGPDIFATWMALERQQSSMSYQPSRSLDGVEEKDPYRVVLFPDIQPYLLSSFAPLSREVILDAFLAFCQLPPYRLEGAAGASSRWWSDGFIRNQLLHQNMDRLDGPFDLLVWNFRLDQHTLFPTSYKWFSAFVRNQSLHDRDASGIERSAWILSALKALVDIDVGNDEFAIYCLAFELSVSPNTVIRTARSLLQKHPSSVRLYNAYALLEYRLGNHRRGEEVIIRTLNMRKLFDETARSEFILLWRTWIWELLDMNKTLEALQRLLSYTDGTLYPECSTGVMGEPPYVSSTLVLRTEKALSETRDYLISRSRHKLAATAAECLVLLTYLRDSSVIATASTVYKQNLGLLAASPSESSSHEHFRQAFARLIYHHATHNSLVKPAEIRSLLAESLAAVPHNTILLSLYAWNEARFRIDDRVRSIVQDVALRASTEPDADKSVVPHFFAIHHELSRGIIFGSNFNSIRSTFERAVESEAGAHCAGLWKSYFLFEHSTNNRQRAKAVFYRGIRACPWVKELYMLAFEYLRDEAMSKSELRSVYELLSEKELRLHIDLEDLVYEREEE
ncbi:MAG: hypothetical protein Q9163_003846, partial [Psora crenata]